MLPGTFKPIVVMVFAFIGLLSALQTGVLFKTKTDRLIFYFTATSIISTIPFILINYNQISLKVLSLQVVYFVGIFSYYGYRYVFKRITFEKLALSFVLASVFLLIVGILESMGNNFKNFLIVKELIGEIFSGKVTSRIQLTAGEPDWAGRLILCMIPFVIFYSKAKENSRYLVALKYLLVFLFLGTFSLSAYLTGLIAVSIYYLIRSGREIIRDIGKIILIFSIVGGSLFYLKDQSDDGYYSSRIQKIVDVDVLYSLNEIGDLSSIDGSVLIRVGYPLIALEILASNPYGVGLGMYGPAFSTYIERELPNLTSNESIASNVDKKDADQRSFFLKLLLECGPLGFSIFILLNLDSLKTLRKASGTRACRDVSVKRKVDCCFMLFSLSIANMFTFASFMFPLYFMVPALITAYLKDDL